MSKPKKPKTESGPALTNEEKARQAKAMESFLKMLSQPSAGTSDTTAGRPGGPPAGSACAACGDPASEVLPKASGRLPAGAAVCRECHRELTG